MASTKNKVLITVLAGLLLLIGAFSWIMQFRTGLGVTGLANGFSWGLYIANFAFFIGLAAGGMIISSSIYLFNVEKLRPFARIASLSAFGCTLAAGVMVLLDLGKITNILNMFIHPNLASPLLWDVAVVTLYMIITFLSVYFQMLPEWKRTNFFLAGWTKRKDLSDVEAFSKRWSKRVAIVGLPFAVLIHTVTALIFATQSSRHWWNTAVLPPDFVAMAVASGTALVLVICMITVGKKGFVVHKDAFAIMAKITAGSLVVHFFFTAMELILLAWESSLSSQEVLHLVMGEYGWMYAIELILPALAMLGFFFKRIAHNRMLLFGGSLCVILGAFVHRLMLMYPGFNAIPLAIEPVGTAALWAYPISNGIQEAGSTFATHVAYMPTVLEWGVALFSFGLAVLIIGGGIAYFRFIADEYRNTDAL